MEKLFFKCLRFLFYAPIYFISLVFYGIVVVILFVWDKLIKRGK
jgi:hypothetical protein